MKKWVLTMVCGLLAVSVYAQPKGVELDTLEVQHIDFQGQTRQGTIICNRKITNDLREIFGAHTTHLRLRQRRRALHAGQQHLVLLLSAH